MRSSFWFPFKPTFNSVASKRNTQTSLPAFAGRGKAEGRGPGAGLPQHTDQHGDSRGHIRTFGPRRPKVCWDCCFFCSMHQKVSALGTLGAGTFGAFAWSGFEKPSAGFAGPKHLPWGLTNSTCLFKQSPVFCNFASQGGTACSYISPPWTCVFY